MPDPETISLSIAQAIAASSQASLEETRASRREIHEFLVNYGKSVEQIRGDIQILRDEHKVLRMEIAPALSSHARYLDGLQEAHVEALGESLEATRRTKAAVVSALMSKPAVALWGAIGSAFAAALLHHFGSK